METVVELEADLPCITTEDWHNLEEELKGLGQRKSLVSIKRINISMVECKRGLFFTQAKGVYHFIFHI